MKNLFLITMFTCALLQDLKSQGCIGGFIYQYTGITNTVWFKDQSNANQAGWQRDYTNWNFNDGSSVNTATALTHTFPSATIYNVVKETKFSQISNPSNFCIKKDSLYIDASQAVPGCTPKYKMKVQWLTDSIYGISTYYSGCNYILKEVAVNYGMGSTTPASGPMNGIYSSSQPFLTYTLPTRDSNYTFTFHIELQPTQTSSSSASYIYSMLSSSIPSTPAGCHASFFMVPSDSTLKNWTVQDFSSGSGPLSYSWNFGDGTTSTLQTPAHTYSTVGVYTICLTVTSGTCSDTFCSTAYTDTSIIGSGMKQVNTISMAVGLEKKYLREFEWQLYPNPVVDRLNVMIDANSGMDYYLVINDLLGKELIRQLLHPGEAVDISQLPAGIFLAGIKTKQGVGIGWKKLIKE